MSKHRGQTQSHRPWLDDLSSLASAQQFIDLGQQQHIKGLVAFDHLAAQEEEQQPYACKALFQSELVGPLCTALGKALQLLGAVEPAGLLQQVRRLLLLTLHLVYVGLPSMLLMKLLQFAFESLC
jgi:hypothetical protein